MCHSEDSLCSDRIHRLRDRRSFKELKVFRWMKPSLGTTFATAAVRDLPVLGYASDGDRGIGQNTGHLTVQRRCVTHQRAPVLPCRVAWSNTPAAAHTA